MDIDGELFFAPGVSFHDFNAKSPKIIDHFHARIGGFYIEPARLLCEAKNPFPAGVLLASCADALARYDPRVPIDKKTNSDRYSWWIGKNVPAFSKNNFARRFYVEFRCGLVHEARIKRGSVFSTLGLGGTVWEKDGVMGVNPCLLLTDIRQALDGLCQHFRDSVPALGWFQTELAADFENELEP